MAAAHDDATLEPDEARARDDAGGALLGDDEGAVERAVTTVRHGIDEVAHKVKGLLRSDR
ncbi:MAG: hypothetical protein ACLGIC_11510 [Acidimicrobiia bacterium]